ncbi:BREX-2 system adenine-specific DNA-methyltransferase PglX [Micromonospora sp. WMMD980]|uniref:BREX-2 system adenine-specific DNA-methyltransferase PglX n=1 Tax=Micromonospora sp. WMMD980 TaxID=3016088 RepID=UPI002417BFB1|nr:BREX-2 system adenine-specific DNA-methyltransferase PglX [Micromonospora sp. WMMD980]MDG4799327.1 BREX-2 system adenine-specific DNA-methyltransferase PglX [Micromonospora sp. WMMD980]
MIELKALQAQVKSLVDDLRGQLAEAPGLRAELRQEHARAEAAERVGASFETWLDDVLDQAAVAWVLGCVFVRFCEDNELITDQLWIGGDDPEAPADRAIQHRQAYLIANPRHNDRHWLREAFRYLAQLKATAKIFDRHNPVWRFDISGPAAEDLSDFFRRGAGRESLRRDDLGTRFLGDLYQDLSTHAKKTYALLQTPEFVEEFILDRTFEPAVKEFGLPATSVIDPTCGSGHFLLGAFHRLLRKWQDREPATDVRILAERALGQVTGVDINPFAVAIARFRLLIAAMTVCGLTKLERTPAFPVRVATGDSLLPWGPFDSRAQGDLMKELEIQTQAGSEAEKEKEIFAYDSEDADLLKDYLAENQYTVVVGNPPYITVADGKRSGLYRSIYPTVCHRQYALTVPFAKRFFDLAKWSDKHGDGAGHVGQITGNAFMKREFGKKLVERYFAHEVELTEVIDTSGAFIPGHGTPTVILVGRANKRRRASTLRTVLGVRGEPAAPEVPADGRVWGAIVRQIDSPGSESEWVTVSDLDRGQLSGHPWSLSGGGAVGLMQILTRATSRLSDLITEIGFGAVTREDSAYMVGAGALRRAGVPDAQQRPLVEGEFSRDWAITDPVISLWPYREETFDPVGPAPVRKLLWPMKTTLAERVAYGESQLERGLKWFEYSMFFAKRYRVPMSIAFAFVATHNRFVLDRGGKVFNRSAPVIKLPEGATEDDHLRLLGVLNSSTSCFWLKQVSHDKGIRGEGGGFTSDDWERFFEFTGTKLQEFPLPSAYPLERAREIDSLARRLSSVTPAAVAASGVPTRQRLAEAETEYHSTRARMIALQEELDWEVYRLYGLVDEDLTCADPPELAFGERAFEIVLHTSGAQTEWFKRHKSEPIDRPRSDWPAEYRSLVERRIATIASNRHIGLIERPECKRRWSADDWKDMQKAALREWLLDRLEAPELWGGTPTPLSVAQLAERVGSDQDFRAVLELWVGHDNYDLARTLGGLVADEYVPYLPAQRYKPAGLRKRAQWERTWALQRREDAGEKVEIPVPPKYTSADFVRSSYWRARGKLDVPKERFISYPQAGRDSDGSELLGWAGWDHLAQAQALAAVYLDRRTQELWPAHRLLPLLAGLAEIEPWLHQWHAEKQQAFMGGSPADFFTTFIDTELAQLSSDRSALALLRGVPELR